MGLEESNALCLNHWRPLTAIPNTHWHCISGSFHLPTLVRTSHLSHICLLDTLHITYNLCKLNLPPTSLPKVHNSKKCLLSPLLYCTALELTAFFRDLYSYLASQLGALCLSRFYIKHKAYHMADSPTHFWTDQVEDRGHWNDNSQGKIMSLPTFISWGFNNKR